MNQIEYLFQSPTDTRKNISVSELQNFLGLVDFLFTPALSKRVILSEYSVKLFNKAYIFSSHYQNDIVGILAIYSNDNGEYYIPVIVVSPKYQKLGIGKNLLKQGILFARLSKGRRIQLEVSVENHAAIALYKRLGFKEYDDSYNLFNVRKIKMKLEFNNNMNILLTSVGRRGYMVKYFREALAGRGKIHAGNSIMTYALREADEHIITPKIFEDHYIDFLKDYCLRNEIRAIIPLFDIDIPILAMHAEEFAEIGVTAVVPPPNFADVCNDKWETYCFLKDNDILTPKSYLYEEDAKCAISEGKLSYPLVVKPRWGMGSIGVYIAEDENELNVFVNKVRKAIATSYLKYESSRDFEHSVLIQEKINGDEYGLDVINDLKGNNVSVIVKKKLAMRAGETDMAKIMYHFQLEEKGKLLGSLSGHKGNLDVDCFISDGQIYVLEMNCRFGGQYPFSHLAGVNLPAQIIDWLLGGETRSEYINADKPCIACKELIPVVMEKLY